MKSSIFIGTSAMAAASALRIAIQVVILPIVGRFLGPAIYGQIALVSPFIFFAMVLAESGLGACIVRADKISLDMQGTIFSFSTCLSLFIIATFGLFSHPLSIFLNEPLFPKLLLSMSSILVLSAFNIVPASLLLRAKKYNAIAISDIISALASVITLVIGISQGWGIWSIVGQQIALWTSKLIAVTILSHWYPRFRFNRQILKENLKFGMTLTGSAIVGFISKNIDNILIGAYLGTRNLGFYALAFQIVSMPQMIFSGSIYFSVFSKTSEAHRQGELSSDTFIKSFKASLLIGLPIMIGIVITAPLSIPLILGNRWDPAIMYIIYLLPFGISQAVWPVLSGILMGQGKSDIIFWLGILSSSVTIIAILIGLYFGGAGVATGVSISSTLGVLLALTTVAKSLNITFQRIISIGQAPVIATLCMAIIVGLTQHFLVDILNPVMCLLLLIILGVIIYSSTLLVIFHEHIKDEIAYIKAGVLTRLTTKAF